MSYEYRRRIRYVNTKIWILIYNIPIVADFILTACKLLIPRILTLNHILCESDSMMKAHSMLLVLRIRWCHITYAEVYHGFLELGQHG